MRFLSQARPADVTPACRPSLKPQAGICRVALVLATERAVCAHGDGFTDELADAAHSIAQDNVAGGCREKRVNLNVLTQVQSRLSRPAGQVNLEQGSVVSGVSGPNCRACLGLDELGDPHMHAHCKITGSALVCLVEAIRSCGKMNLAFACRLTFFSSKLLSKVKDSNT